MAEKREQRMLKHSSRILNSCHHCFYNSRMMDRGYVIAESDKAYLAVPLEVHPLVERFHFSLLPKQHFASASEMDEDVYTEIRNFQKSVVAFFDKQNLQTVFIETAFPANDDLPHTSIDCVGVEA